MKKTMKCAHFSDTHGHHRNNKYPTMEDNFDVMFHSGDLTIHGTEPEAIDFIEKCNELIANGIFKHIVFTPGNHDAVFEDPIYLPGLRKACGPNVHLLIDEEVTIYGWKIWASPRSPQFGRWSFMYRRGAPAAALWSNIPEHTDIVMTHGPARGVLDWVPEWNWHSINPRQVKRRVGCKELMERLRFIKPAVHLFGHIHEAHGNCNVFDIEFFNSSIMDERYQPVNDPQTFLIEMMYDERVVIPLSTSQTNP